MKRIFLAGLLLTLVTGSAISQGIPVRDDPDRFYYLAADLFREKEYPTGYRTIESWFTRSKNPLLIEDASFLRASMAYELNKPEASLLLIGFIKDFPLSAHLQRAYYLLGCTALNADQWEDALGFFKRCPLSELTPSEMDEYKFRFAYASLQTKDFATARRLFSEIVKGENRYIPSSTYFLAYMDYADGKIELAREGFEVVNDQAQYKDVTNYFKLQLLYIDGKSDEMIGQAEAMLKLKTTPEQRMELVRLLGAAWFDKKRYNLSHRYYQEYLAMNPVVHRSDLYRMGINYYTQRNYPTAINYLTQASGKQDALSQSASYHMGLCYLKQEKKDQARMSFEDASRMNFDKSTQEKALYNYALLCYENSFSPFNEQVKAFQRILTEFPESEFSASANAFLSEVFLTSKEFEGSLEAISNIPNPDNKMLQTKSRLLFKLGLERYNNQKFFEARNALIQAGILADSLGLGTAEIDYWRGECSYRLNMYPSAAEDFKKVATNPDALKLKAFALVNYQLGYAYFQQGLYNEARTWFEKYTAQTAVKKEKTYTDALNRIGDCYFQAKDIVQAEKNYQAAELSQAGGSDYATYQRAMCQGARNLFKAKADLLQPFLQKYPKSELLDNALFELADAHIRMDKAEPASQAFNRLLEKCPESPLSRKAYLSLAEMYVKLGKPDDAIASYKKVIEYYPESEEAKLSLKGLKGIFVANNSVSNYLHYTAGIRDIMKIETGEEDTMAFQLANGLQMNGKHDEAIEEYSRYLQYYPAGAFRNESRFHLGRLLLDKGQREEGLAQLDTVAHQTGSSYQLPATRLVAEGYFADKQYQLALDAYNQLESLSPDRSTRLQAGLSALRCSYLMEWYKATIEAAEKYLSEENPGTEQQREVLYLKAMSLLMDGQGPEARAIFTPLSKETQTSFGAESRFRLAESFFNENNNEEAERVIQKFVTEGSTQSYWLARSFVLMADICLRKGDVVQAGQYLNSLRENYQAKTDVQEMITQRLNELSKRSN